jgi:hypothetical protein
MSVVILGDGAWLMIIWQLLALVNPTYVVQLKLDGLARCWGLLTRLYGALSVNFKHLTNMLVLDGPITFL